VEEAHGSSVYSAPAPPRHASRLGRQIKNMNVQSARRDRASSPPCTNFQTPHVPFCARTGIILRTRAHERLLRLTMRAEPESVGCEPVMIPDETTVLAADAASPPPFRAPYAPPDEEIATGLLREAARARDVERRLDLYARRLIEGIRAGTGGLGGIEDFL